MHIRKLVLFLTIVSMVLAVNFTTVSATKEIEDIKAAGARVNVTSEDATNVYAAGARVNIKGTVKQDIWAAGALVNIDTKTDGDIHAAGSRISIMGKVAGKARLAGADVKIDAVIGEELNVAAASINIFENAKLPSNTSLAAALIEFNGTAGNDLRLYADEVIFSGKASGPVTIEGHNIQLDDTAQIEGDLTIRSSQEALISPNATIVGEIIKTGLEDSEFFKDKEDADGQGFFLILSTSIFLLGLILILFLREFVEHNIKTFRTQPTKSFLWGLVVFFGIPIFVVITLITIIGLPIGVATLLLLPFLVILGFTTTTLGVSDWLFNRTNATKKTGQRILLLLAGVIIFAILGLVPFVGGLLIFLALLFGLGVSSVTIGRHLSTKTT